MSTFLVGYDLDTPGQDYSDLYTAIKALGDWWHHLDSTWLVKSESSAVEIRNTLKRHIDDNDEILVINVTGRERAWTGFNTTGSQWLRDRV